MPRKGMSGLWFSLTPRVGSPFSPPSPSPSRFGNSPYRQSFSESVMDRTLEISEPVIAKWDPETTTFARVTSLFYENRREAREFIKTVNNLHKAMHLLVKEDSNSEKLIRAKNLIQIAMKRLQKEFYQILSMNRAHLDPESVSTRSSRTSIASSVSDFDYDEEDDDQVRSGIEAVNDVGDVSSLAMADLRLIADCMISCGYGKECVKIYKIIRKSIVDEAIYKLGVLQFTSSQIHKMDWRSLDLRVKNWLDAVGAAVKVLFNGERILCDHVFNSSDSVRESCFTEISKSGALILFGFPELVAKYSKKSPEKIFRLLDMYTGISNHWPEIESIFSFPSADAVKSQAVTALVKLGESVRAAVDAFETSILKDSSKSPVAGAGIHALTINSMNYLSLLADYSVILSDIFADSPPPAKKMLPDSYFGFSDSDESTAPAISLKMAWLILVLLCKLDAKAKYYKDISLSYLFLANNLQYVVVEVQTSNLKYLLGGEWVAKHEAKVKQFASNYERLGWGHVIESLPSDPAAAATSPERVKETFKKFNAAFDQAYKKQSVCVVQDSKLRDHIKVSIARKIFRLYREFYAGHRPAMLRQKYWAPIVKYTPEDVGHRLSDLFFGEIDQSAGSVSSVQSSPSPSLTWPRRSR
ncbi:exocyst complex component EXO70H1-like [Andrographis paniculata]|uniref:exocyst complex component EXO70H1-like n=1 Tax=Andrographis paniculata TaxID=175694 RepID=UPI0021E7B0F2|nr:exocyst complex component EXO70H1-like [Andrographis paniculata]